jgi:hypothetical protein
MEQALLFMFKRPKSIEFYQILQEQRPLRSVGLRLALKAKSLRENSI